MNVGYPHRGCDPAPLGWSARLRGAVCQSDMAHSPRLSVSPAPLGYPARLRGAVCQSDMAHSPKRRRCIGALGVSRPRTLGSPNVISLHSFALHFSVRRACVLGAQPRSGDPGPEGRTQVNTVIARIFAPVAVSAQRGVSAALAAGDRGVDCWCRVVQPHQHAQSTAPTASRSLAHAPWAC